MAEFPTALWLTFTFVTLTTVSSSVKVFPRYVKSLNWTAFGCKLDVYGTNWTMECDSGDSYVNLYSKVFIIELQGDLDPASSITFETLLNSTVLKESGFYSCDSQWRYYIKTDPSILKGHCESYNRYLRHAITMLEASSLIAFNMTRAEKPHLFVNVLSDCFLVKDVIISENSLPFISTDFLSSVHPNNSIKTLSLQENRIETIANGSFNFFHALTSLDLSHNLIKIIDENLFYGISGVSELDMSHNLIENVTSNALKDLESLKNILLNNNKLITIHEDTFRFNIKLSVMDLSYNDLKYLPSTLFHNMTCLRNISCSHCNLFSLSKDLFLNSPNVEWIVFNDNKIEILHEEMFKGLKFLQVVDLSKNQISYLYDKQFSNLPYLMYFNLSINNITDLKSRVFQGTPNIRFLDLSVNRIRKGVTDDYIKNFTDLEYFGLHHNMMETIELGTSTLVKIRKLDISHNLINRFNVNWKQLVFMEIFKADFNLLTSMDLPPCINSVKQTLTFSFTHNNISTVNMDALILDEERVKIDKAMAAGCFFNGLSKNFVDLSHNPFFCNCNLYPFYKYIRDKSPRRYQLEKFLNKGNITCAGPSFLNELPLHSLSDDVLSCPVSNKCPPSCYCGIRGTDHAIFVNCSSRGLKEIPKVAPDGTTAIYFNGNGLTSMEPLGYDLWRNVTELHLDYNLLTSLDGWKIPTSLYYLSVKGNRLKTLPHPVMQFISNSSNFRLYFGDNDKNCDCKRKTLKNFLRQNINFIEDNEDILCIVTNNGTSDLLPLTSIPDSDLCPQESSNLSYHQKRLVIYLCTFFVFLISIVVIYYRQRQLILSFFYIHCHEVSQLFCSDELDEDKIFDAFIAYSSTHREIVLELLEELENNPPFFHLCIHERNWLPGRFIIDNIADSVENSKRTIIILSNAFISSPWFNIELRAAVCRMSQDKINRIIIILAEKSVSFQSINPELRHVISKRTYLVWGERWFWEKLKYALPRKKSVIDDARRDSQSNRRISEISLIPDGTLIKYSSDREQCL